MERRLYCIALLLGHCRSMAVPSEDTSPVPIGIVVSPTSSPETSTPVAAPARSVLSSAQISAASPPDGCLHPLLPALLRRAQTGRGRSRGRVGPGHAITCHLDGKLELIAFTVGTSTGALGNSHLRKGGVGLGLGPTGNAGNQRANTGALSGGIPAALRPELPGPGLLPPHGY